MPGVVAGYRWAMRLLERLYEPVTAEARIPAPPSAVYDVLADPETYPDWLVGADHMRAVDPDFPNPGSRFQHSVGPGGALTVDDETESLEADAGHHLALLVHAGPFHARVDFDLRRDPDGGTTVSFSERPVGALRAAAASPPAHAPRPQCGLAGEAAEGRHRPGTA